MQKRASGVGALATLVVLAALGLRVSAGLTVWSAGCGDRAVTSQVGHCVPPAGDSSIDGWVRFASGTHQDYSRF
jgi:hypothetical protein